LCVFKEETIDSHQKPGLKIAVTKQPNQCFVFFFHLLSIKLLLVAAHIYAD